MAKLRKNRNFAAEESGMAAYAVAEPRSLKRKYPEPPEPAITDPYGIPLDGFDLDRHRILHCTAFRRLHDKTQVFVRREGDHARTRLTHTVEVADIAQRMARTLLINPLLAESIALAHDLGHPPFGHAGEAALAELMADHGGFEHNLQSLRVVEYLEHPYPDFRGLNLTFEVREGLAKHQTRYDKPDADGSTHPDLKDLLRLGPQPSLEAQIVNLADELAYTLHDIEDGLLHELVDEAALNTSRLWTAAAARWRPQHPDKHLAALRRPILDTMLDTLIDNAAQTILLQIDVTEITNGDQIRRCDEPLAEFSDHARAGLDELQEMIRSTVYRSENVAAMDAEARETVRTLFNTFVEKPELLPARFANRIEEQDRYRVICDYVAGMTDSYCRNELKRVRS